MKIVQANLQRDYGGAEIHVRTLANGLRSRGHDVRVFCHPNGRLRQLVETDGIPTEAFLARNQLALRATLQMTAFLLRTRPDVIHLHTPKDYVCGMVAARLARIPSVVITRHLLRPLKPVMRSLYMRADAVVCMSQGLRNLLRGQGIPTEMLCLLPAAIDVSPFDDSASAAQVAKLREKWDIKPEDIVVGCPGRLVGGKGQEVLLDAFARSSQKVLRLRLIFAGDGPERQALETRAIRLGIAESTRFIGFSEDMRQTLAALDIVVIPSIMAELMPLAVLESMAASRPVIASDIGGIPEILTNGKTGCLVPPGDADALDNALCRLAANADLRRQLSKAAANHVRTYFALPRLLDGLEDLYARLTLSSRGVGQETG